MLQTQDLDPVGLFIPTHQPLELDREIDVRLRSPIGMLRARAHVVQVITQEEAAREGRRAGFAVVFIGLADDQRAWIDLTLRAISDGVTAGAVSGAARLPSSPIEKPPTLPAPSSPATERRQGFASQAPKMLARLEQELVDIAGKAPWELLGVDQHADPETARAAFLEVCKRYHPHTYARFDSVDVSRIATQLFIAHKRAYTKFGSLRPPAAVSSPSPIPGPLAAGRMRGGTG
jgi:hypothetical protein